MLTKNTTKNESGDVEVAMGRRIVRGWERVQRTRWFHPYGFTHIVVTPHLDAERVRLAAPRPETERAHTVREGEERVQQ